MGARRESRAYRRGFVLGALAGAGVVIWNAPQPGWRTREQIMETVEGVLFRVLDFPEQMTGLRSPAPADSVAAERPVAVLTPVQPYGDLGTGTDIVIDGPRPSELAR